MPSIREVEEFSQKLFQIAKEPEVLRERGEEVAKVELPKYEQMEFSSDTSAGPSTDIERQQASDYSRQFQESQLENTPSSSSHSQSRLGIGQSEIADLLSSQENPSVREVASSVNRDEPVEFSPPEKIEEISDANSQSESDDFDLSNLFAESSDSESIGDDERIETNDKPNVQEEESFEISSTGMDQGGSESIPEIEDDFAGFETDPPKEQESPIEGESGEDLESLIELMREQDLQSDDIQSASATYRKESLDKFQEEFSEEPAPASTSEDFRLGAPEIDSDIESSLDLNFSGVSSTQGMSKKAEGADTSNVYAREQHEKKEGETFTEEEYNRILKNVDSLPFDVRAACAEFISNPESEKEHVSNIVTLLKNGGRQNLIVRMLNRYTGSHLQLPYGYEKGTAAEYFRETEEKKNSPARKFIRKLAVTTGSLAAMILFSLILFNFVYRPLLARSLYKKGHEALLAEEYSESDALFEEAWTEWENDSWALRYAQSYTEIHEYFLASKKYDELIYGIDTDLSDLLKQKTKERVLLDQYDLGSETVRLIDLVNVNKTGIFEHSLLQSNEFHDFARADDLLSVVLVEEPYERNALILQGDNYVRWSEEDPSQLLNAGTVYQRIIQEHGIDNELNIRLAWYAQKSDNLVGLRELLPRITDRLSDTPIVIPIFTDIAQYLMENNELAYVAPLLKELRDEYPYEAGGHYWSAQYFRMIGMLTEERVELENTIAILEASEPLRWDKLSMYIDSNNRIAELAYDRDRALEAESLYQKSLERYVLGLETNTLEKDAHLARFYEGLGDIRYFYSKNFEEARRYFERALEEGRSSRELFYKTGNTMYREEDYALAVELFLNTETHPPRDAAGLLATASALYHLENYSASEAYFFQLTELLDEKRDAIRLFSPFENAEHNSLILYMIKAYNGLGVSRYRIAERKQDPRREAQAVLALEQAIRLFEDFNRSQENLQRSLAKSLPYVNLREVLYPQDSFDVSIDNVLPASLSEIQFDQFISEQLPESAYSFAQ